MSRAMMGMNPVQVAQGMTRLWIALLSGASVLCGVVAGPVRAQTDPVEAAAPDAPLSAEEAAAQVEFLSAQIEALQAQVEELKKAVKSATPTYRAAPEWKQPGMSFKVGGQINYDAGYVSNPHNAVSTANLGFNSRARRVQLGVDGEIPGDFKYRMLFEFAQSGVAYEDIVIAYEPAGKPLSLTLGYFYPYNSLENLTSSRNLSVVERAQMNDAFGNTRRLGIGMGYANASGDFRLNAGVFGDQINATFDNNNYMFVARAAYDPLALGGQLHFGLSGQYRNFKTQALGFQYRARPFTQTTDQRFVDTGNLAARGDSILGVEAAGIFGALHVAGEAQYLKVRAYQPGAVLPAGRVLLGTTLASDPSFVSAYGEAGYWLTGETRGWRNGKFDRIKVLHPFSEGGWGAVQLVGRIDYLDLTDTVGGTGTGVIGGVLNGGTQTGYLAALHWWPIDYVRFSAQYIHSVVTGGPRAAAVVPVSSKPVYDRSYGVDAAVVRAQLDF